MAEDEPPDFLGAFIALLIVTGILLLSFSPTGAHQPRDLHRPRSFGCLQYLGGCVLGSVVGLLLFRPHQAPVVVHEVRRAFSHRHSSAEPRPPTPTTGSTSMHAVPGEASGLSDSSVPPPPAVTADAYSDRLRDATSWAAGAVPLFECSDPDVTAAYYYRWRLFWLHLKHDPEHGNVLTEFLPHVNWAGPLDTINCPFGHQSAEARWLRTPEVLDDYSTFWWRHPRADRRYTWWPAHAAATRHTLDGRTDHVRRLLPHLRDEYWRWANSSLSEGAGGPCAWQACHDDGQENSIGLDGCRPTLNAVMHGEALALSRLSRAAGDAPGARGFAAEAARWRRATLSLWSAPLQFFVTRTRPPPAARMGDVRRRRTKLGCLMCPPPRRGQPRCPPQWRDDELVDVREIAGLTTPWYFGVAGAEHAAAWRQLTAAGGFAAAWGFTTAERRHRCFNFSTGCVTSWHAPVWPFESAKLGTAMIAALRGTHAAAVAPHLRVRQYFDFLAQYARMHTRGAAEEVAPGEPFVGESFHGDGGYWLTRRLMFERRHGDKRRGDHYFHSSFCDLVLAGLVGIDVDDQWGAADGIGEGGTASRPTLVVHPLFEASQLSYLRASRVRVRGRDVEVTWDVDGTRYKGPVGLAVWVDGRLRAHSHQLLRLTVRL